jgi:hypothetical protein
MRNFIIGLSIIFFVLSGIITFKSSLIPVNTSYQNNPQELKSKGFSRKNEGTHVNLETERSRKTAGVLAVLGGRTFRSGQVVINEDLMNVVKEFEILRQYGTVLPQSKGCCPDTGETRNIP